MKRNIILALAITPILLFSCKKKEVVVKDKNPSGTPETVTDIDGNEYKVVQVGEQKWMAENLRVTRYRNGDPIPTGLGSTQWENTKSGAYAIYDDDPANDEIYGKLYNGYAVADPREVCPAGWHTPSDEEWKQMEMALGMTREEADDDFLRGDDQGAQLKDTTLWGEAANYEGTNSSGFSALPGGSKNSVNASFQHIHGIGSFWTSTPDQNTFAWHRNLGFMSKQVERVSNSKRNGFSCRCVKD